jgi:hypothetical protein
MFRAKFWLSFDLTIPTVVLSPEVAEWIGYTIPSIPGIEYVPAVLGTIIFFYGGLVFLRGARVELADRKPGMMTLISLAIVVAFLASWAGSLGLFEVEIWWELATLITIMLLGHWLEMRSIAQARGALNALAALLHDTAERVTDAGTEEVPIAALVVGDIVLVRPGARIPADGAVAEGNADVDESMITGRSGAVPKEPGDSVVAGTVATGGSLDDSYELDETTKDGDIDLVLHFRVGDSGLTASSTQGCVAGGSPGLPVLWLRFGRGQAMRSGHHESRCTPAPDGLRWRRATGAGGVPTPSALSVTRCVADEGPAAGPGSRVTLATLGCSSPKVSDQGGSPPPTRPRLPH